MLLTEQQVETTAAESKSVRTMQLRLRSGAEEGQLLDLPSGKTTIGSSPRCNIRIQSPGVQPVHCLIVHEPDGTTVRRWADDALLNGGTFEEASLAAGDILSLGSVDMQVVGEQYFDGIKRHIHHESEHQLDEGAVVLPAYAEPNASAEYSQPAAVEIPPETAGESWHQDTVHHTTVCFDDDELAVSAGNEQGASVGTQSATPPGMIPAAGADEVYRQLQAANAQGRSRVRNLLAALRDSRQVNQTLFRRIDALERQIQDVLAEQAAQSACEENGQPEEVAAPDDVAEIASLNVRIEELERTRSGLIEERATIAAELDGLRQQLSEANRRCADWEQQANHWSSQQGEWAAERADWNHQREERQVERSAWTTERNSWQQQASEWEQRLADQCRRIEELESQQAAATASTSATSSSSTVHSADESAISPDHSVVNGGESQAQVSGEEANAAQPLTMDPGGEEDSLELVASKPAEPLAPAPVAVSDSEAENEDSLFPELAAWKQQPGAERPVWETDAEAAEIEVPAWQAGPSAEPHPWDQRTPVQENEPEVEPFVPGPNRPLENAGHTAENWIPENAKSETSFLPNVESSAPESGAFDSEKGVTKSSEPGSLAAESAAGDSAQVATPQSTSYIERFAHMFADEEAEIDANDSGTQKQDGMIGKLRNTPVKRHDGTPDASGVCHGDEESLEDYMAKMMQRLRGEKQAPPSPAAANANRQPDGAQSVDSEAALRTGDGENGGGADQGLETATEFVRKATVPEPPTNLAALRALANETARSAIGAHATRTRRKQARTKVAIAVLAGATSVFLMLLAPSWSDLQFVSACVALVAAVYWGGRALLILQDSISAGTYNGPKHSELAEMDPFHPPLPIDVES